ncbi:MAG: hypothetical protein V1914_03820 [archaeon]
MNKKQSRKGLAVIGWVLMVGFTIVSAMLVINWVQDKGGTLAEETVTYAEGKIDCQAVRLANLSTDCLTGDVELKNIGTLHIVKVMAQINDERSEEKTLDLKAQGDPLKLNIGNFKSLTVIPIIQSSGKLLGCKEKNIRVYCP